MNRTRPWVTAGVALVGAGVVAVTPVAPIAAPLAAVTLPGIQLAAADMVIDLVRHGESQDNLDHIIGTTAPGPHLTALGQTQADDVAQSIFGQYGTAIHGVFASELTRTQETAAPLADLLGLANVPALTGFNEVPAGWLEGDDQTTATGLLYLLPVIQWAMGNYLFPVFGSATNGVTFDDGFDGAMQTVYESGGTTNVAFTSAAAMGAWTLMNVKNPDFGMVIKEMIATQGLVPNTGQIVVEGNPTDGWTLLSWNGTEVAENPDLVTGLFLDYRDLITAPQIALWHIWEAIQGGDQADITAALQTGFNDVLAAFTAFPESVMDTITGAMGDAAGGGALATSDMLGDLFVSLAS